MTKNNLNGTVKTKHGNRTITLRDRAEIANKNHADLAVSIHDDDSQPWETFAQVYIQEVGLHRDTASGKQIKFTNKEVAEKSKKYGTIFAKERTKEEKHKVTIVRNSFNGRAGLSPGNLSTVQLLAEVPWVYGEVGARGKLTNKQMDQYAKGIIAGVEASVPTKGKTLP